MNYSEHIQNKKLEDTSYLTKENYQYFFQKKRGKQSCFHIYKEDNGYKVKTGYFIGVDWIEKNFNSIFVQPKMNFNNGEVIREINFLEMLFKCLKYNETAENISELIEVKWNEPEIEIEQEYDILTPFNIINFLIIVKKIANKGLKKSYNRKTQTLKSRIKGKMLVKQTMNKHLSKGNVLDNVCSFDIFEVDNKENRILKKAIGYIKKYMLVSPLMKDAHAVSDIISFLSPLFEQVSSDIDIVEIKQMKSNTLFKEYDKAIRLAKMIIKRFGYGISNAANQKIKTPPFWIDMPILFELYVLSYLKDIFRNDVKYHFGTWGNVLDFLLNSTDYKMVIDAKYKPNWKKNTPIHEDVRQVSGYARLSKVYETLDIQYPQSIKCLIIYPDIENGKEIASRDSLNEVIQPVKEYQGFYKLGIKIPTKNN